MPFRNRNRNTLGQGLDREVYQVLRKIIDEQSQFGEAPDRISFATVYDEIRRSNSSLNRKPKKLLEDSVERVLATVQQETAESDSEAGMDQNQQAASSLSHAPTNGLNRSIVGAWSTASPRGTSVSKREQDHEQSNQDRIGMESETAVRRRQPNGEPMPKKRKATTTAIDRSPPTHVSFADVGGVDSVIEQFEELLVLPMKQPEYYTNAGIQPPRGVLIFGPPGCGKTMIANVFAAELRVNFISISAPSIVSGMSGESEKALRDHFEEAKKCAPCLMFIDEIDAIAPKREGAQREMEKRIVAQLMTCMDDLALERMDGKPVIVLAATNKPDSLDTALRRGGRFDKEINMSVPNEPVREKILRALVRKSSVAPDVDFALLARRTPGFVGADLNDLVSTAGASAIRRVLSVLKSNAADASMDIDEGADVASSQIGPGLSNAQLSFRRLVTYTEQHSAPTATPLPEEQNVTSTVSNPETDALPSVSLRLSLSDFLTALPKIQPSALREGFATIPSTTFASIGALSNHISELESTIIEPILNPTLYSSLGITPSSGALLWGPPGCGKTLLAKAAANSSHANFISVKGPELLNKYVGESERAVRQVFNRARSSIPVIIFFDELDALVPRRDGTMSEASARVVNTLLTELDGVGGGREGIYIIAATNRPDIIDPAMLRPGRLDTLLFVGLPDAEGRVDILKTLCRKLNNFVWTEQFADVARQCEGFSGADLEGLLTRAGYAAVRRWKARQQQQSDPNMSLAQAQTKVVVDVGIEMVDFQVAMTQVGRTVREEDMKRYERLQKEWGKRA